MGELAAVASAWATAAQVAASADASPFLQRMREIAKERNAISMLFLSTPEERSLVMEKHEKGTHFFFLNAVEVKTKFHLELRGHTFHEEEHSSTSVDVVGKFGFSHKSSEEIRASDILAVIDKENTCYFKESCLFCGLVKDKAPEKEQETTRTMRVEDFHRIVTQDQRHAPPS
eukprot:m.14174 g.14174  ORF g.14174 m.14174 type:complete len:173 (+) comp7058_c0_seq2:1056-1574(+)